MPWIIFIYEENQIKGNMRYACGRANIDGARYIF